MRTVDPKTVLRLNSQLDPEQIRQFEEFRDGMRRSDVGLLPEYRVEPPIGQRGSGRLEQRVSSEQQLRSSAGRVA